MKKMNKKGFTLIEMLVVIAIIAILVSIIIPVVQGSTTKAKYATNAANLRSVQAEYVTKSLTGDSTSGVGTGVKFYDFTSAPAGAPATFDASANLSLSESSCTYDGLTAAQWGNLAGNGS